MKNKLSVILMDDASVEDQFSGRGHSRTAEQLGRSIEELSSHEKNRSIGLYGDWGSGKTTVIGFTEKLLNEKHQKEDGRKYRFFVFDLWSSTTTQFKRTFLEELIDWGMRERKCECIAAKLLDLREKVRDREITTTSEQNIRFSIIGILLISIPFLIQAVYFLLGPDAFVSTVPLFEIESLTENFGEWLGKVTLRKLALLGLLILMTISISSFSIQLIKNRGNIVKSLPHVLSAVSDKEKSNTITQRVREKDPNEHEFDNFFRQILALIQNDNSKVVVIFENIDRLYGENLSDCWALVRSVFSSSNPKPLEENQSFVAIVSYVPEVVKKIFFEGKIENDVFAKTFDIQHRTSRPVLSNISGFLDLKIKEQFRSSISAEEKSALVHIFEFSSRQNPQVAVTPRDIKNYINEVAQLHMTWNHKIPIQCIAIYVLNRDKIDKRPYALTVKNAEHRRFFRFDNSGQTTKFLAALTFNVEPDMAYQVLLLPEILNVLSRKDEKSLEELEIVEGFVDVLRHITQAEVFSVANDGLRSLSILAKCVIRNCKNEYEKDQFAQDIAAALASVPETDVDNSKDEENIYNLDDLDAILEIVKKVNTSKVLTDLSNIYRVNLGQKPIVRVGQEWGYLIQELLIKLEEYGFGKPENLVKYFDKDMGPGIASGIASTYGKAKIFHDQLVNVFKTLEFQVIFESLLEEDPDLLSDIVGCLIAIDRFNVSDTNKFFFHLNIELSKKANHDVERYTILTRAYSKVYRCTSKLSGDSGVKKYLSELIDLPGFSWHIHKFCCTGENSDLLALAIELTMLRVGDQRLTPKPGNNDSIFSDLRYSREWFNAVMSGSIKVKKDVYQELAKHSGKHYFERFNDLAESDCQLSRVANAAVRAVKNLGL